MRIQTLAILLLLFVTACAKSNTPLGRDKDGGEEGGALSDDDAQLDSAASSGGAASSVSDGPTGTVRAGNSGQGGTAVDNLIDAGVNGPFPTDSIPPPPVVGPLEDPEVRRARLDLISEYCSLYEKFPCLDQEDPTVQTFDTIEESVSWCESSAEFVHNQIVSMGYICESEWEQLLKCAIQYPYSCPCWGAECALVRPAGSGDISNPIPCVESINAFGSCFVGPLLDKFQSFNVTGERMTCNGTMEVIRGGSLIWEAPPCQVTCPNPSDGSQNYEFLCEGPILGPYICHCVLNQIKLYDAYSISAADQRPDQFVPDCESATKLMADGECHDITDCCFTWVDDDGNEGCGCTADVTQSSTGAKTCEELAAALGGQVVDLCPQYKNISTPPR